MTTTSASSSTGSNLARALVAMIEFLVPPLRRALEWDPIEFDPLFPEFPCKTARASPPRLGWNAYTSIDTTDAKRKSNASSSQVVVAVNPMRIR